MSTEGMTPDIALIKRALRCRCPKCHKGALFTSRGSMSIAPQCNHCGLNLGDNDIGDGPAVFLIFILGALLVPLALLFEAAVAPPLWAHAVLWSIVAIAITLGSLRPLKSYIMALQYKHRPGDWADDKTDDNAPNKENSHDE